ncbi:hypothetical protein [uncultured Gimesia sp.]|uniref:hypothetical protein n=1 Tax=uncultured Gimesia sp. TaxID=1678688 RepID=UPI0030DA923E|tara:strand:+ start:5389 stop:5847 length:459 start_codon:yes stop_codon:yes gene_type:complete
MEWSAFLIYLLTAACCSLVVWFVIKVGFRTDTEPESVIPEPEETQAADSVPDAERQVYWNFTAALIVVPTLLLVLGISMQTASFRHPVTGTLAGALVLIWGMVVCSGMLSFSGPTVEAVDVPLTDFPMSDFPGVDRTNPGLTERATETEELS